MSRESLEVQIARIDENVLHIRRHIVPKVNRHERDILAAKVLVGLVIFILAVKHPVIADVFGKMFP